MPQIDPWNAAKRVPLYSVDQAARYLRIPTSTVRSWVAGRSYRVSSGERVDAAPLLQFEDPDRRLLSFDNLLEIYALNALRRGYGVSLPKIRAGLECLASKFNSSRPLLEHEFLTDRSDLYVKELGRLWNVSSSGQGASTDIVHSYLERVEHDDGVAVRLFPVTRRDARVSPRVVAIDPRFRFGRPFIAERGVETSVIAERYYAGDSLEHLSEEYGCSGEEIAEAIGYEPELRAA